MTDDISLYISKETIEKREYLIDFYNRIDIMKSNGIKVDAYKIGMNETPKFWSELYEDDKLPEEKCIRVKPRIGKEYQINIKKIKMD